MRLSLESTYQKKSIMKNYFFLLCFMYVACFSNCQREQLIAQTKPSASAISPTKSATASSVLTDFKYVARDSSFPSGRLHATKSIGIWDGPASWGYEKINSTVNYQKIYLRSGRGQQTPEGTIWEESLWFKQLLMPLVKDQKIVLNDASYFLLDEGGCSTLARYELNTASEKDNYIVFTNIDTVNHVLEGYLSASFEMDTYSKEKNNTRKNKKPERMDFINGEFKVKRFPK